MKLRKTPLLAATIAGSIFLAFSLAAQATDYKWTKNSVATQTWTTAGNWDGNGVFATGNTNTLTFFSDITTALANGNNVITTNVPTTLTLNALTLNGKGAAATAATNITIGTSSSTWTLDGTTPTVKLNGLAGTQGLNYTVAANLTLAQTTTAFSGNGTAGFNFSGIISGSSKAITKSGTSTLTLSGNNNYTGATTINAGKLTINTQTGGLSTSSAISILNGSTLNFDNTGASGALAKSFGSLTASAAGENTVIITRTAAQDQAITFSTLGTRAAGTTINFVNTGGTNSATNGFILTGVTANSFINQGTFFGGSDFAWNNAATSYVRGINYGTDTNSENITASTGAFTGTKLYEKISGSGIITGQTTATITSLNIANANNVTLGASQTLTVNGILKSGGAAGGSITGGTGIQAGWW